MKTMAKIKYTVLKEVSIVETWYKGLTNVDMMKFSIAALIVIFFMMWFHASFLNIDIYKQERYISNLKEQITDLQQMNDKKDELIAAHIEKDRLIKEFVKEMFLKYYTTSLTGYHPTVEQCDSTPDITADGTKFDIEIAGDYKYVALSRDLLTHFKGRGADITFGDYILIKGTPKGAQDGIYQVRDTMNKRHTQWIDILLTPGEQSFYYRNILMIKIENPEYVGILNEIYENHEFPEPIAMLDPEV
jgi:cell division protein FtsL